MSGPSGSSGPGAEPPATLSERTFRLLLRVYPATFREEYGADAVELFRDCERDARSRRFGLALLWLRTLPSLLWSGLTERLAGVGRAWRAGGGGSVGPAAARSAWRSVRRAPALSATIVATLGLGIGANVALFSVVRGVLIRPLPYPEPERLVRLWERNPDVDDERHGPSPLNALDWAGTEGVESMASWYLTSGTVRTDAWVEEVRTAQVSADFFRVLGVGPILGRAFAPDDVGSYGPMVLSYGLWQRLFAGDAGVVGRTIPSGTLAYEIVGVMPPDFSFPDESVEAWIGWDLESVYADRAETRSWRFLDAVARLERGLTPAEAERRLDARAAALAETYPEWNRGWGVEVGSLLEETVGEVRSGLWIVFGGVLFILLIACANVATLLLARVPARARELGIRTALGASRARVALELAAEYAILAVAAAAAGLVVGAGLLRLLVVLDAGRLPRLDEVSMDGGVYLFTAAVASLTCLGFGLVPALQVLRGAGLTVPAHGTRTTAGAAQRRAHEAFVSAQVAIAVLLSVGAGLFSLSFQRVMDVDPGIDPRDVASFRVSLGPAGGSQAGTVEYYRSLLEELRAIQGVEAVAATQTLPFNPVGTDFRRPYRPSGSTLAPGDAPTVQMRIVTPGYVNAMGMELRQGGPLPEARAGEPLVALVNETLARRLWPDWPEWPEKGAVGETFEIDFRDGWESYRVEGVVRDVRHYGLRAESGPEVFLSHRQVPYLAMTVVARTSGEPEARFAELDAAVRARVPAQPPSGFVSLERLIGRSVAEERFLAIAVDALSLIGLVLALTGVYGTIAYTVSRRRREIGLRMAVGAHPRGIVRAVLLRAVRLAALGCVAGLAAYRLISGALEGVLYEVDATDPRALAAVAATMLVASALAAYLPARRAAGVPPSEALRAE